MSVAIRTATRLVDQDDVNVTPAVGVDEYALTYDHDTGKFVLRAPFDGTPYALLAGRAGGQTLYGGTAANDDITIHGTSDATRTTSYVLLQPTAGNVGIGTASPLYRLDAAETLTQLSGIKDGFAFTTTMSPATDGMGNYRNIEYILQSGTTKEIGSATNFLAYQYINSYAPSLSGVSISTRYGATANVIASRLIELTQDSKVSGAAVATKTALYIASITHGNTNYAIYTNAGLNRLGDQLSIVGSADRVQLQATGFTTQTGSVAQFISSTAATDAIRNVLTLGANVTSTGVGATGLGAALLFQAESSTTADTTQARIAALWNDHTHSQFKSDLVGYASDAAAEREIWRGRANGSAPAIGFLGATPQARIAHVADPAGGATVDAEARSAINSILSTLELFGFHAAS